MAETALVLGEAVPSRDCKCIPGSWCSPRFAAQASGMALVVGAAVMLLRLHVRLRELHVEMPVLLLTQAEILRRWPRWRWLQSRR